MRNQRFALGIAVAVGLGCAWEASAQVHGHEFGLVAADEPVVVLDCAWGADCLGAMIVVDTPKLAEESQDLSAFRASIQDLLIAADDPTLHPVEPTIVFSSWSPGPVEAWQSYEHAVLDELDVSEVDCQVILTE